MRSARRSFLVLLIASGGLASCTLTHSLDEYDKGSSAPAADAGLDVTSDAPAEAPAPVDATDDVAPEAGCPSGFSDCDNDVSNGCETDTRSSLSHCGACDAVCSAPSGDVQCQQGVCRIAGCPPGTGDCNVLANDGCEVNVLVSEDHCGACGRPCPPPNAVDGLCTGGACAFTCSPGRGDCDLDPLTGCETDLSSNPDHCGTCGNACPAPPNAQGECHGALGCAWSCVPLRADCDGDAATGCERDVSSDVANCGACLLACPANFDCVGGLCSCRVPQSCDHGGGGKCLNAGGIKVCECAGVSCAPGEVCLPGPVCGPAA